MLTCDSTTRVEVSLPSRSAEHAPLDFSGILLTQQALSTPGHIHNTYILYIESQYFFVGFFFSLLSRYFLTFCGLLDYPQRFMQSRRVSFYLIFFADSSDLNITLFFVYDFGWVPYHYCSTCQLSGPIRYSRMLIFSGPILHGHVNLFII